MPKIEMKINRYIKHIGKNDLICDNGACIQGRERSFDNALRHGDIGKRIGAHSVNKDKKGSHFKASKIEYNNLKRPYFPLIIYHMRTLLYKNNIRQIFFQRSVYYEI